ncbi:hypothetical protein GQR58_030162 [Nymphon striatum]|nr:hypothetical protein GQR58_030162 [Nymphon striatum]
MAVSFFGGCCLWALQAWRPVKPISTSRGSPDAGLMMSSEAGSGSAIFGSDGVLGELLDERDHVRGRMNGLAGGVREVPGMHQELKAQNACEHFSRGHAIAEGQLAPKPSFAPGGKTRFHGHSSRAWAMPSAFRRYSRWRPCWRSSTRPASFRMRRCWETAGRDTSIRAARSNPVAADTGATQFTRMSGASSTARPLVSVMTAPFDALYGVSPLRGRRPPIDAVLTIELPGRHVRREVLGRKEHASDIDRPHEVELLGREIDHVATTMRQPGIGGRRCRYHPTQRP